MAQVKKKDKRERILETAMRLFAERGFRNVSLDEIAREARVGKGTIYIYFDSKLNILEEAAKTVFNSFTERFLLAFENSKDVDEFIENLVNGMVENIYMKSKIMMLFHKESSYDREKYFQTVSSYREILKRVYEKFIKGSEISYGGFQSIVTGFFMAVYMMSENIKEEEIKGILRRVLRCILESPGGNGFEGSHTDR